MISVYDKWNIFVHLSEASKMALVIAPKMESLFASGAVLTCASRIRFSGVGTPSSLEVLKSGEMKCIVK